MGGCSDAKVTMMVLSVDLNCCSCYRKVKKLLCKFPQIRDQVFDEKSNTVSIKVVCCSPDKIRDRLCEKGGKSIKVITVMESKKADPEKLKANPKPEEKPKEGGDEQTKDKKEKPKDQKEKPKGGDEEKTKSNPGDGTSKDKDNKVKEKDKDKDKNKETAAAAAAPVAAAAVQARMVEPEAQWVPGYPPPGSYPVTVYYGAPSCYSGVPVGPTCYPNHHHQGYGYKYVGQQGYCGANRSDDDYFSDEDPGACSIM